MDALKFAGFSCLILLVFSNINASTGDDVAKALAWFTGCQEPQISNDVATTCSKLVCDQNIPGGYTIPSVPICKFLLETHKDCLKKLQNLNCTTNGKNNSLTVANLLGHPDLRMCETFSKKFEDAGMDLTGRCANNLFAAAENVTKCLEKERSHQSKNISICALGADNYVKCTQVWNSEKCFKQNKKMKTLVSSVDGIIKETFNLFCIPNYGKDDKAKQCNKPDDVITKINQCLAGFLDEFPYDTKDSCNKFKGKVDCAIKAADECAFGHAFRKFSTGFIDASCNSAHGIISNGFQVLLAVFASVLMWLLNVKSSL